MNDQPNQRMAPKPLPDPRDKILSDFRSKIQGKIQQLTGVPDGQGPIEVTVQKKSRRRPPRVSDADVEKAKIKIVEFARKGPTLFEMIRKKLDEPSDNEDGITKMEEIAEFYLEQMKKPGSFQFFKEIIDREMGKVPDKIESSITVVQPNLPLIIDDFNRVAAHREEDDSQAGRN